jgi:hypothetical protein
MGGEVIYGAPAAAGAVYSDSSVETSSPVITTEPAAVEAAPSEGVIEASPSDVDADTPAVDPNAFIIRNGNVRG